MWLSNVSPNTLIIEKTIYNYINLQRHTKYFCVVFIYSDYPEVKILRKSREYCTLCSGLLQGFFNTSEDPSTDDKVLESLEPTPVSCVFVAATSLAILCVGTNIQPLHYVFYFSEVQAFTY